MIFRSPTPIIIIYFEGLLWLVVTTTVVDTFQSVAGLLLLMLILISRITFTQTMPSACPTSVRDIHLVHSIWIMLDRWYGMSDFLISHFILTRRLPVGIFSYCWVLVEHLPDKVGTSHSSSATCQCTAHESSVRKLVTFVWFDHLQSRPCKLHILFEVLPRIRCTRTSEFYWVDPREEPTKGTNHQHRDWKNQQFQVFCLYAPSRFLCWHMWRHIVINNN